MRELFTTFREAQQLRASVVVTIAFFCHWGKHRSVALAHLFAAAWGMLGGQATLEHLSKDKWGRRGCGWKDCDECNPASRKEQREQLTRIFADWIHGIAEQP